MSTNNHAQAQDTFKRINGTFGQYRAEYIEEDLYSFFTTPNYWNILSAVRPCFLEGGRGTGKTTALRGMAYEGQRALKGDDPRSWDSFGAYWRIESNVVSSFKGRRIPDDEWPTYFSHYVNIQLCLLVLDFIEWRDRVMGNGATYDVARWSLMLSCFNLENLTPLELRLELQMLMVKFQSALLGLGRGEILDLGLTPLGVPIKLLLEALAEDRDFKKKYFAFCIDEYENLIPYQQHVINTLIKHTGDGKYTFKIGVKKYGISDFLTLSEDQPLQTPADYSKIDIAEDVRKASYSAFSQFAADVCNKRLESAFEEEVLAIEQLFGPLSIEEEARILGIEARIIELRARLEKSGVKSEGLRHFDGLDPLSAFLVQYWAKSQGMEESKALEQAIDEPESWYVRKGNYAYAMLFTIRPNVRGFVKYYAGWETFVRMSDGNIRLLLQLVYESLVAHTSAGSNLSEPVSPEVQTKAASKVGEQQVETLQSLSRIGGRLMQLVFCVGRVFEVMARQPHGHAPEVNQFRINKLGLPTEDSQNVTELLKEAIMHSAIVAFVADKKGSISGETKASDFMLHPITSAFFTFSDRRKRRMTISGFDFLEMASDSGGKAINRVLLEQKRNPKVDVPEQLTLYSEFFNGDN